MTSSSAEAQRAASARSDASFRAIDWSPEEFALLPDGTVQVPSAEEQDDLIEAITAANAAREQELEEEMARREAEAYARGYEDGQQQGEAAEGARLRNALRASEAALDEIRNSESRWRGGLEENICALAIAVAKQVLEREVRSNPGVVLNLVRRALTEFPADQPVRIRVSPTDLALITSNVADAGRGATPGSVVTGDREARWIADPMIAPGGCVVEGRERIIDGRIDSALERLYRRLTYTTA